MSLRENMARFRETRPRVLELIAAETKGQPPIGYRNVGPRESVRRIEPLLGLMASGEIPIDDTTAPILSQAMEQAWRDLGRQTT